METEISFIIHWSWVIWTASIIAAIAFVGGVGFLIAREKYQQY